MLRLPQIDAVYCSGILQRHFHDLDKNGLFLQRDRCKHDKESEEGDANVSWRAAQTSAVSCCVNRRGILNNYCMPLGS